MTLRGGHDYPRSVGEFLAWFGTDADCDITHRHSNAVRGTRQSLIIVTEYCGRPARRRGEAEDHPKGSGFARAITSQQPGNSPGFNLETHVFNGSRILKFTRELSNDD